MNAVHHCNVYVISVLDVRDGGEWSRVISAGCTKRSYTSVIGTALELPTTTRPSKAYDQAEFTDE